MVLLSEIVMNRLLINFHNPLMEVFKFDVVQKKAKFMNLTLNLAKMSNSLILQKSKAKKVSSKKWM